MNLTVDNITYSVTVASAASDTTVTTSGSGTSLINTSTGGDHVLNSVTAGANVTITDDNAGNLTFAATEDNLSNNTTTDLSEGTNQYFTDARVMTSLETVSGNIIPDTDNTRYLGSATKRFHSLYLGPGSLYIDDTKVIGSDVDGDINFTSDTGQAMVFGAGGDIRMTTSGEFWVGAPTTQLGTASTAVTTVAGELITPKLTVGLDTVFTDNNITATGTNDNFTLQTNGNGYVWNDTILTYVGNLATGTNLLELRNGSITTSFGDLAINAAGNVTVAGHNTTVETAALISTAKSEAIASAESKDAVRATAANAYADAAVNVLTSGASATHDTLLEIQNLMATDAELSSAISGLNHDSLAGFVANEHIDWTVTGNTIHADNYTDTDTVYTAFNSDFDTRLGTKNTANLTEGTNLYYTDARAIAAIEAETTLDLTGTVTVDDLTLSSGTYGWGANFNKIGLAADRVLELNASGSGYIYNVAPQTWIGDNAGAFFTSNSGAATTLKPWGGQALHIGPNPDAASMVVTLEGNVTGNVHGDIDTSAITTSTTDEDIEVTTNGTGLFKIDDLEFSIADSGWGEPQNAIKATGTNHVLRLEADNGNGYIWAYTPNTYIGVGGSGALITGASGSAPILSHYGGQALTINAGTVGATTVNSTNVNADTVIGTTTVTSTSSGASPVILKKKLNFDHSASNGALDGNGLNLEFKMVDEADNDLQIAANFIKLKDVTTGGSTGSSTITDYHGEYTLTIEQRISDVNQGGLNALTVNKDFTNLTKELRIADTPRDSGNTSLSALYLTYDGAETGTPTAKVQLRNDDTSTTTSLIELTEAKVDFKKVVNLASNTTTEQNALTAVAGDMIFNTTTSKFMGYNGSAWVQFHG